jgi:hypothetical protein
MIDAGGHSSADRAPDADILVDLGRGGAAQHVPAILVEAEMNPAIDARVVDIVGDLLELPVVPGDATPAVTLSCRRDNPRGGRPHRARRPRRRR